jgi:hypothetical protein
MVTDTIDHSSACRKKLRERAEYGGTIIYAVICNFLCWKEKSYTRCVKRKETKLEQMMSRNINERKQSKEMVSL